MLLYTIRDQVKSFHAPDIAVQIRKLGSITCTAAFQYSKLQNVADLIIYLSFSLVSIITGG